MTSPTQTQPIRQARGFTLMEILIAMAIVGILAAIAIPSYQEHVRKSRRVEAATYLLQNAQYMQRFYGANSSFQTALNGSLAANSLPFRQSPPGQDAFYTIELDAASNDTQFTLLAVPVDGMPMAADPCGTLTLTNTGVRGMRDNSEDKVENCWR